MSRGFVFGKYLPFHFGHKAKIDFAFAKCDELFIVVCASDQEKIKVQTRINWIKETYPNQENIHIIGLPYSEKDLPNTSESSKAVSKLWADKFSKVLPRMDLLITSEAYGDYVAEYMGITHILFDQQRHTHPISASQIRRSFYKEWEHLPEAVKKYYQIKIVFLGTESTGKSSIIDKLAKNFKSSVVKEVGRAIIADSSSFSMAQLEKIARVHAAHILSATAELQPFLLIDTDIHITQSYAKYEFGQYMDISKTIYEANRAHVYFYLNTETAYVQDGTRLSESERNKLDHFHRTTLEHFHIQFTEIKGDWNAKYHRIAQLMQALSTTGINPF